MESTFVFDVLAAGFAKQSNFFCGAGLQYTPLQEFENALATFVEPFPTPALPGVSIELPSMYLTLFEFCFHESEFVLTVCYQIQDKFQCLTKSSSVHFWKKVTSLRLTTFLVPYAHSLL